MKKLISLIALFVFSNMAVAETTTMNELQRKIDLLAEEIQALKAHQTMDYDLKPHAGLGGAASKVYSVPRTGISIGAYGEIVYAHQAKENQDGDSVSNDPTAEAYRMVLYLGYKFSDKWVFNSEIEIEHVNEIYNEFMYVDYLASKEVNYRAGLILLPVGIVNEQHEPTLFSSVNRPDTDKYLVPSTWREIGLGIYGDLGAVSYKAFLVNGADGDDIAAGTGNGIRKGRKKGGASGDDNASTGAIVLRGDYNLSTDSFFGFSLYHGEGSSSTSENLGISLYDIHAQYTMNALRLRAQFDIVNYTNSDDWNDVNTNKVPENFYGGYLEAQYTVNKYTPFIRYERINLNGKFDDAAFTYNAEKDYYTYRAGLAYKPVDRLTFKADYAVKNNKADNAVNEFNLGMGFNF